MTVHAFVVSWKGQHENASLIAAAIRDRVDRLSIVFSDPDPGRAPNFDGDLIRTNDDLFWSDKFMTCLDALAADVMLVIHADCSSRVWPETADRCRSTFSKKSRIGIWGPLVNGAGVPFELVRIADMPNSPLSLVGMVDMIVFAIPRSMAERLRGLDYRENIYGWGIDWAAAAFSYTSGRVAVIDRTLPVDHPSGAGYDGKTAARQMGRFMRQLAPNEFAYARLLQSHIRLQKMVGETKE